MLLSASSKTEIELQRKLAGIDYFIAGGYVVTPDNYSDIDVFFYTETDYLQARKRLGKPDFSTEHADTYHDSSDIIQLINSRFGSPYDITSSFDLHNCCKALLPDGQVYTHPDYNDKISVNTDNLNSATIKRLFKLSEIGRAHV